MNLSSLLQPGATIDALFFRSVISNARPSLGRRRQCLIDVLFEVFRANHRLSGNYHLSNRQQNCYRKSNFRIGHDSLGTAAYTALQINDMRFQTACVFVLLSCCTVFAHTTPEQEACSDVHLLARMARTKSSPALRELGGIAGDSYRSRLVFAFRLFEIDQADMNSALRVIELIPRNADEDAIWHSLEGSLCEHESVEDMKTLGSLQARLPHDLAEAMDRQPNKMYEFISYAYESIQDPQSDYAVQMKTVCRRHHELFLNAVNQMSEKDRNWFTTKIFNSAECRAIALPEAD